MIKQLASTTHLVQLAPFRVHSIGCTKMQLRQRQRRQLSLHSCGIVLSNDSLSILNLCLCEMLAILWNADLSWMIPPEKLVRSSSIMRKSAGSTTLATCLQLSRWFRLLRDTMAPLQMRAIGSQFSWTLNQEVVFSAALTGKPKKLYFSQYCWKRCVIGTKHDYTPALSRPEWQYALSHGDLPSLQEEDCNDPLIFSPANNTEFLNIWKHFGVTSG